MRTNSTKVLIALAGSLLVLGGCPEDTPGEVPTGDVSISDTTTPDTQGDSTTTPDNTTSPDTPNTPDNTTTPDTGPDVPNNDCGNRECGLSPSGASCGTCSGNELCNAAGQCVAPANPLGSYCGANAECPFVVDDPSRPGEQRINPNWPACANSQCQSNFCFDASGTTYSAAPVCSKPCTIQADNVNNATGANTPDGVDDEGTVNSQCSGFEDGPSGSEFRCVSYSPPGGGSAQSYCTPGTTFAECKSTEDCPAGEMCALTIIGGALQERCIAAVKSGDWGEAVNGGEDCNESDPFEGDGLKFCKQGGLCFGFGCANYCDPATGAGCDTTKWDPDAGCDTTAGTCKTSPNLSCTQDSDCSWLECGLVDQTVFSNSPYTGDFCFPKNCETNNDCANGLYCRFSWGGESDDNGLPVWEHICLPQVDDGVGIGEECDTDPDDNIPGNTCKDEDMCFGGYCSAICTADDQCGTDQFCHVIEFTIEDLTTPAGQQSLPLSVCLTYKGSQTACLGDADCGDGERCERFSFFNPSETDAVDGPILKDGKCVATTGLGETGANCNTSDDCIGGWCIGADAAAGEQGFCSQSCASASECPAVDAGDGETFQGICTSLFTGYGGDSREIHFRTYDAVCQFTGASATDCSFETGTSGACGADEFCGVFIIGSAANTDAITEYLCLSNTNPEGEAAPSVALGGTCDPTLETAQGAAIEQCLSGLCFEGAVDGEGYCTQVCDPAADTCAADTGIPTAICSPVVSQPRRGVYAENSGQWYACRKDENCAPCAIHEGCAGDRVCVNLGADNDTLADYRCVPSCTADEDCTADKGGHTACNTGTDFFNNEASGCFDPGATSPVNFCSN